MNRWCVVFVELFGSLCRITKFPLSIGFAAKFFLVHNMHNRVESASIKVFLCVNIWLHCLWCKIIPLWYFLFYLTQMRNFIIATPHLCMGKENFLWKRSVIVCEVRRKKEKGRGLEVKWKKKIPRVGLPTSPFRAKSAQPHSSPFPKLRKI